MTIEEMINYILAYEAELKRNDTVEEEDNFEHLYIDLIYNDEKEYISTNII